MLELFFAVAFSAVPLILYVPPLRSFNPFVQTLEGMLRQTRLHTDHMYPRLLNACSAILHRTLHSSSSLANNNRLLHPRASNAG
uniref:Uncharacterized protein n=1 Tax=Kalanchoe fedtschenkoi TaxID=63787 RepID=A0A7N0T2W2_KALFE